MTQVNSISSALDGCFGIPPLATGIAAAVMAGIIISGGIKRIGSASQALIPFFINSLYSCFGICYNLQYRKRSGRFFAYFQREKPSLFFQNPWGPRSSTVLAAHRAASAMPSRRVPPCARAYSSAPEKLSPAPVVSTERQGSAS